MAINLNSEGPGYIFLPTNSRQDFEHTRILTIESYLEFLIWSKGLKSSRYDFFVGKMPSGPQQIESLDKAYFDALPPTNIDDLY